MHNVANFSRQDCTKRNIAKNFICPEVVMQARPAFMTMHLNVTSNGISVISKMDMDK